MNTWKVPLLLTLLGGMVYALPSASLSLRSSYGGAVLEGRVSSARADAVLSVSSNVGKGRLMKCSPKCSVVSSIPLQNSLVLGVKTPYRVALGGKFRKGQRVNVVLRLKNQGAVVVSALVSR